MKIEDQQQKILSTKQERDWAWKIGVRKKESLWTDVVVFNTFVVNLCIRYFNSDNQRYTMCVQKDLMILEFKRKISLSHSICWSALPQHSFIWFFKLQVKLENFFLKLSVCLLLYRDLIKHLFRGFSCGKLSCKNIQYQQYQPSDIKPPKLIWFSVWLRMS